MMTEKTRTYPNRSYLRLVRLYRKGSATWTEEEKIFVEEMEQLLGDINNNRVPRLCGDGRVDALFLALERCRYESAKHRPRLSLEADAVIVTDWLVESLRDYLAGQWFTATPREREQHSVSHDGMERLYSELKSEQLGFDLPLSRGAVLSEKEANCARQYLVDQWLKGTPGLRGRHSTTDERVKAWYRHYHRYSVVEELREAGKSLMRARLEAPDHVADAAELGSAEAFQKSHKIITKAFKDDPEAPLMALLLASFMAANAKAEGSY